MRVGDSLGLARGRSAGVCPGLGTVRSADGLSRSRDNGTEELCMAVTRLPLSPAAKVAASGDKSQGHEDSKDGRESSREACPVYVDEAKAVVGMIQGDIVGLVMDLICDT